MDYYDLLGVKRSASADELKTAYKRQAMKNHPDKGGDPEKFKQINEAYQNLSDPQKRQMYDQFGTADPQQAGRNQGGFHFHSGPNDVDLDNIFSHFGFGRGFRNSMRRNADIALNYQLGFADIFTGKNDTITFRLQSGRVEVIDIRIPAGVKNGDTVRFKGYGDDSVQGVPRGDLIIQIHISSHKDFVREGQDIYTTIKINILDLMIGTTIKIAAPDGTNVDLNIPSGTKPSTIFSLTDKGVPFIRNPRRGKLFVKLDCIMPNLSPDDIEKLRSVKKN